MQHSGYKKLVSYQVSKLLYEYTVRFADLYISRFSRTRDQKIQSARSTMQNLAEGSMNAQVSSQSERFLTGIARGSANELKLDFENFLIEHGLPAWERGMPLNAAFFKQRCTTMQELRQWSANVAIPHLLGKNHKHGQAVETRRINKEVAGNVGYMLCLASVGLISKQMHAQRRQFLQHGGVRERDAKERRRIRNGRNGPNGRNGQNGQNGPNGPNGQNGPEQQE